MMEKFRMVELEAQLCADTDGSLLTELCGTLEAERLGVKRRLDAGLPPEEFERAQAIQAGLECAKTVLTELWNQEHR